MAQGPPGAPPDQPTRVEAPCEMCLCNWCNRKEAGPEGQREHSCFCASMWKAPYHFTATTAMMNFLLFVALTLLHELLHELITP